MEEITGGTEESKWANNSTKKREAEEERAVEIEIVIVIARGSLEWKKLLAIKRGIHSRIQDLTNRSQ